MQDNCEEPHATVCDNLDIAEFFIKRTRTASDDPRPRWCLIIAANALWSAVEVFNKKVASKNDEQLTTKNGKLTNTTNWFKQLGSQGRLIEHIRTGAVHTGDLHGIGETMKAADDGSVVSNEFYWVKKGNTSETVASVDEAISWFTDVAKLIRDHVFDKTRSGYIRFG
jgi:hypothetical protein